MTKRHISTYHATSCRNIHRLCSPELTKSTAYGSLLISHTTCSVSTCEFLRETVVCQSYSRQWCEQWCQLKQFITLASMMACMIVLVHSDNSSNTQDTEKKWSSTKRSVNIIPPWIYSEFKKIPPPAVFWHFFANKWEFFNQFLHTYYTFLSTLEYKFLFNYLQLWWSYAILSSTTQRIFTFH